jgi:hypothetical protein
MSYWYDKRHLMSTCAKLKTAPFSLVVGSQTSCRISHGDVGWMANVTRMRNWLANLGDLGGLEVSRATETASVRINPGYAARRTTWELPVSPSSSAGI